MKADASSTTWEVPSLFTFSSDRFVFRESSSAFYEEQRVWKDTIDRPNCIELRAQDENIPNAASNTAFEITPTTAMLYPAATCNPNFLCAIATASTQSLV